MTTLFEQLEIKIDQALETVELLRLEIEDMAEKNRILKEQNDALKHKQHNWENGLNSLLRKLESSDLNMSSASGASEKMKMVAREEEEAMVF